MSSSVLFDAATHTYRDVTTGTILPSVTTVLHAVGLASAHRYTDAARERGTHVHALVRDYFVRDRAETRRAAMVAGLDGYLDAFIDAEQALGLAPILVERPMADPIYGYAGTPDLLALDRLERMVLVDIKTGGPQPWHKTQIEAYARLSLAQPMPYHVEARVIVYLTNQRATITRLTPTESTEHDAIWLAALRIYKTRERWRVHDVHGGSDDTPAV